MRGSLAAIVATFTLLVAMLVSVGDADAAACQRGVRSKNSNTPVTVTFINKSGEFRGVMWADFKGKLVNYANLNPGQKFTINTFLTHPWIFTNGPGDCVEMFMPSRGVSKYTLTVKSKGGGDDDEGDEGDDAGDDSDDAGDDAGGDEEND